MENIQNEEIETSQNNQEDLDSNQEEDDTSTNESTEDTNDVDVLKQRLAELEEKNKQLYERAKKGEVKSKEHEAKYLAAQQGLKKQGVKVESVSSDPIETIKLFNALKDYSQDEIEYLAKQSKVLEKDLVETAKDEDVKLFIQAKREKLKNEKANPIPGTRQDMTDKNFDDWTPEDIQKLSENPTPENLKKQGEYIAWMKSRR